MHHAISAIVVDYGPLVIISEGQDLHTSLAQANVVLILAVIKEEALALAFPKLETLMSEYHRWLACNDRNIHDHRGVCIHENSLVSDDQLFDTCLVVLEYLDVAVPNVKLVLPFYQEWGFCRCWVIFVHDEDKESQFFVVLIADDEKALSIRVVDCLADGFDRAECV